MSRGCHEHQVFRSRARRVSAIAHSPDPVNDSELDNLFQELINPECLSDNTCSICQGIPGIRCGCNPSKREVVVQDEATASVTGIRRTHPPSERIWDESAENPAHHSGISDPRTKNPSPFPVSCSNQEISPGTLGRFPQAFSSQHLVGSPDRLAPQKAPRTHIAAPSKKEQSGATGADVVTPSCGPHDDFQAWRPPSTLPLSAPPIRKCEFCPYSCGLGFLEAQRFE